MALRLPLEERRKFIVEFSEDRCGISITFQLLLQVRDVTIQGCLRNIRAYSGKCCENAKPAAAQGWWFSSANAAGMMYWGTSWDSQGKNLPRSE